MATVLYCLLGVVIFINMKKVLKVGSKYVGNDSISFGYTTLVDDIQEAKFFDSFNEASSYIELLFFDCEIVSV